MNVLAKIVVSSFFVLAISAGCSDRGRTLGPELAFNAFCMEEQPLVLEQKVEAFLKHSGFRVLNLGTLRRESGPTARETGISAKAQRILTGVNIVGIDEKRRLISVRAAVEESWYFVGLNTPPQSQRATDLDPKILDFFSTNLGCKIGKQINRATNDSSVRDLHDSEVARVEGLFKQAEELRARKKATVSK